MPRSLRPSPPQHSLVLACSSLSAQAPPAKPRATGAPVAEGVTVDATPAAGSQETPAQRDARMRWWREAKFGLFIHWGVYAVPAGKYGEKDTYGEWIMHSAKIPVAEYRDVRPAVQPREIRPGRVGARRQGRGHALHRHHVEAPRRVRAVPVGRRPRGTSPTPAPTRRTCSVRSSMRRTRRASRSASTIRRRRTGTIPAARSRGSRKATAGTPRTRATSTRT